MNDVLKLAGAAAVAAMLAAAPAAAQQHLYCTDARGAGLFWDRDPQGAGRISELAPTNFTVNVVSAGQRHITKQQGGVRETACHSVPHPDGDPEVVSCRDRSGTETWVFYRDRYFTRSYLFGTPLQARFVDPNIYVAHGTCRPF